MSILSNAIAVARPIAVCESMAETALSGFKTFAGQCVSLRRFISRTNEFSIAASRRPYLLPIDQRR
jgi:hypothetical protein